MLFRRPLYAGIFLAAVLAVGLAGCFWLFRPSTFGERVGVPRGAELQLVVVQGPGGEGSVQADENPAALEELSGLLNHARLQYDQIIGGAKDPVPVYSVTVYTADGSEGTSFGADGQGYVYQSNRRYALPAEDGAVLAGLLEEFCS